MPFLLIRYIQSNNQQPVSSAYCSKGRKRQEQEKQLACVNLIASIKTRKCEKQLAYLHPKVTQNIYQHLSNVYLSTCCPLLVKFIFRLVVLQLLCVEYFLALLCYHLTFSLFAKPSFWL